ncbi:transcription factor E2F8 isoform X1 [Labrus mixtus]|uniref:transcription factor E2F8 isoform X1 n=2 Tax=Labrus mixtus TaxID=508554 RepID=UPI0029C032BB|nr:transcription factor E2F8 isoform X1 [Labrus mixtus]
MWTPRQIYCSQKANDGFVAPLGPVNTPVKLFGDSEVSAESHQTMGPLTTPKKGREVGSVDPWTPTSNLKMLISAASPEIRNREKELCMDNDGQEDVESTQETENGEEKMISRKEKSLGLLCHKFLARYPDYPNPDVNNDICLDDVATELNVERRRIYDIMNVLESLHMVSRSAKNRYSWHGRTKLAQTLAILKQVGEEHKYGQQMQQIKQRLLDREFDFDGEEKENEEVVVVDLENGEQGQKELFFVELPGVEFKAASVNSRKDKSLRVMSQKFVMLFLVCNPRVVSLEVAAKILIGEDQGADQDKNKFKTKVRRLYDIANVLRSLKLIEKVHVTEERGRKPAFEWVGPEEFPQVKDLESVTSECLSKKKDVLESRASADNCAKNLFSSPGRKRSFTRHPSLIKLAKSIQDDRRKINSAPTSPVKSAPGDSSNGDFPNKMAQLAAICKIQLDQEYVPGAADPKPAAAAVRSEQTSSSQMDPPQALFLTPTHESGINTTVHLTPNTPLGALPAGSVAYIPAHCSSMIPVLLPQQRGNGPYAVYLQAPPSRPNPLARPQPTSLAVRSMTFEDKTGQSPTGQYAAKSQPASSRAADISPLALKRLRPDSASECSPSKAKRTDPTFRDTSPKLSEILQARLKAHRGSQLSSRPSPRALHLDPEFVNTPGAPVAIQTLGQSLETFLDREDKTADSDREAALTPVRAVPITPGQLHTETLVPAGYLIPISQQSLIGYKEMQSAGRESNKAPTPAYIYKTPTAGSRPTLAQEMTPTNLRLHKPVALASPQAAQLARRLHSPSPAILNFTLQNLGLISGSSPGSAFPDPQTPENANTMPSPLSLQQRGMVFIKPVSPMPLQQSVSGQPLALISLQQPLMTTPKGTGLHQPSFFHTPVPLSPLAAVVTTSGHPATKTVYIPQRKLDVNTEDSSNP